MKAFDKNAVAWIKYETFMDGGIFEFWKWGRADREKLLSGDLLAAYRVYSEALDAFIDAVHLASSEQLIIPAGCTPSLDVLAAVGDYRFPEERVKEIQHSLDPLGFDFWLSRAENHMSLVQDTPLMPIVEKFITAASSFQEALSKVDLIPTAADCEAFSDSISARVQAREATERRSKLQVVN